MPGARQRPPAELATLAGSATASSPGANPITRQTPVADHWRVRPRSSTSASDHVEPRSNDTTTRGKLCRLKPLEREA